MVENIFRHLAESREARACRHDRCCSSCARRRPFRGKFAVIANAATEVNQAILFAAGIIIAGFVPLFTLSGIEGHIFGPMARTYGYAIAGGLIATFTISPALSALLLPDTRCDETETCIVRALRRVLRTRRSASRWLIVAPCSFGLGVLLLRRVPRDALRSGWSSCRSWRRAICGSAPRCRPRSRWRRATATSTACARLIASFPEVETVVSQHGRPDDGTDATGFFNAEFFVPLQAQPSTGRAASTRRS